MACRQQQSRNEMSKNIFGMADGWGGDGNKTKALNFAVAH